MAVEEIGVGIEVGEETETGDFLINGHYGAGGTETD